MTTVLGAPTGRGERFSTSLYLWFQEYVQRTTGIYYPPHRRAVFESRIGIRVTALGLRDAEAYRRYLLYHPRREAEFLQLASALTNNETFFFREVEPIETALRLLLERRPSGPLRILSAGGASGEELATVAMLLRERGVDLDDVVLEGFDLDVRMVARAQAGVYRGNSFRNTSSERLLRFFQPTEDGRRLKPAVHRHLRFRWGNLVEPETMRFAAPFDLVLCRNVLIYFRPETIQAVARTLHGLLAEAGILLLGVSESLASVPFLFDPVRSGKVVYYRKVPL